MTLKQADGGPAFPLRGSDTEPLQHGMTLRQYYAGQALVGLRTNGVASGLGVSKIIAATAWADADAMIAEGEKE